MASSFEQSVFFVDNIFANWYQSATPLQGFIWCEQNGSIIYGSKTVPVAEVPPQTGNDLTDIATWLTTVLQNATGTAPVAYTFNVGFAIPGFGVDTVPAASEPTLGNRPAVALGNYYTWDFGALNLPDGTINNRQWFISFRATDVASEFSPAINQIIDYETGEAALPILETLELKNI